MATSIWNSSLASTGTGHLMFCVVGTKGLSLEKPAELFVRISGQNYKDKTRVSKKDMNATWNEVFYIESAPSKLEFSLHSPDGMSDKFWGEAHCDGLDSIESETIIDRCIDLASGNNKTKRTITGQIQIRFIRTTMPTCRSLVSQDALEYHFEHRRVKKFNSGDLILFAGSGPHNVYNRLSTGVNYSSAGILLQLPNKYTKAVEWYVMEATENVDKLLDPMADTLAPGLRLFKLEERLYNYHGAVIWWVPQAKHLDETQIDVLRNALLLAHSSSNATPDRPFPLPNPKQPDAVGWKAVDVAPEAIKFLSAFYDRSKADEAIYFPLRSAQLIGYALTSLGLVDASTTDTSSWTMKDVLVSQNFKFAKKRLLRVSRECHMVYTDNDTDKNSKVSMATTFAPATSFAPLNQKIPSEKSFASQAKQISGLVAANRVQLSVEESNMLNAASKELIRKKA